MSLKMASRTSSHILGAFSQGTVSMWAQPRVPIWMSQQVCMGGHRTGSNKCFQTEEPFPNKRKCVWPVQCQSAEQYTFWAWNRFTEIPCLAGWDYDKVPWLHHYYCCAGFLFTGLFRLTFVMLLKSNSLLVPDSAVLLVCARLCKNKRMQSGNMVSSGWHGWDGGPSMGLKRLHYCIMKCVCVLQGFERAARCLQPRKAFLLGFRNLLYLEQTGKS